MGYKIIDFKPNSQLDPLDWWKWVFFLLTFQLSSHWSCRNTQKEEKSETVRYKYNQVTHWSETGVFFIYIFSNFCNFLGFKFVLVRSSAVEFAAMSEDFANKVFSLLISFCFPLSEICAIPIRIHPFNLEIWFCFLILLLVIVPIWCFFNFNFDFFFNFDNFACWLSRLI